MGQGKISFVRKPLGGGGPPDEELADDVEAARPKVILAFRFSGKNREKTQAQRLLDAPPRVNR
jgi:hypothetical protein